MTDLYAMFLISMKIASMATKGFLIDFDYVENESFYVHILKDDKEWFFDRSAIFPTTTLRRLEQIEKEVYHD